MLHLLGLILFIASFFVPAIPNEMTSSEGQAVKVWQPPVMTHLRLAFEPLARVIDFINAKQNPNKYGYDERGDAYDYFVYETVFRFFYSIPASLGWFIIWLSGLLLLLKRHRIDSKRTLWRVASTTSALLLAALALLSVDFYRSATTYEGHFHLGAGAYFILAAYLLVGICATMFTRTINFKKLD